LAPGRTEAPDVEIGHHIDEYVDRLVADGKDPAEARHIAEQAFGDARKVAWRLRLTGAFGSATGELRTSLWALGRDVLLGLRSAWRRPGLALTLVLSLAISLGSGAAVFSVADAMLFRPLPFPQSDMLVGARPLLDDGTTMPFMYIPEGLIWMREVDFLQDVSAVEFVSAVRTDGQPETLELLGVTPGLGNLLGVDVAAGRFLAPEDAAPGSRVAVASYRYWHPRGTGSEMLGATIEIDGEPLTVVGLLPKDVKFPPSALGADLWVPIWSDNTVLGAPINRLSVYGRLPEGVGLAAATERSARLAASLSGDHESRYGWSTLLTRLEAERAEPRTQQTLLALAGSVGLLFVVALGNCAVLSMIRVRERLNEIWVRTALGASPRRVIGQLVTESTLVALAAGTAAVAVAAAGLLVLRYLAPAEVLLRSAHDPMIGPRVLSFAAATAIASGMVMGLIPAALVALQRHAPSHNVPRSGRGARRVLDGLVVLEVSFSVALLVGAGLLLNSFVRLTSVDPGFEPEGLTFVQLELPEARYPSAEERASFFQRVEARLEGLPGVQGVTSAVGLPPARGGLTWSQEIEPEGGAQWSREAAFPFALVGQDYLAVLGTSLALGRPFQQSEMGRNDVVMIDEDFARALFGSTEAAVGARFRMRKERPWLTVVGVIEELRLLGLDDRYDPFILLRPRDPNAAGFGMGFAVRASSERNEVARGIRAVVSELDEDLPIAWLETGTGALGDVVRSPALLLWMVLSIALSALVLGGIGVYGVLSAAVANRRKEVGIRVALGAGRGAIRRLVLAHGMTLGAVGVSVGLVGASAFSRVLDSLLYGVAGDDSATLVAVVSVSLGSVLLASWLPVRRALAVAPNEVLKSE
jgi:predicted permease